MPYRREVLPLARRIVSQVGRLDHVRVQVVPRGGARFVLPLATGGASILSSTTRADGFVLVEEESEGIAEGQAAEVRYY